MPTSSSCVSVTLAPGACPRILGLMSGTSCDGLDLALLRFGPQRHEWVLEQWAECPFTAPFRARLLAASSANTQEISALSAAYARLVAAAVHEYLELWDAEPVDLVVSHGQTVHHNPGQMGVGGGHTLQLGDGNMLSALLELPVLWNLRSGDVALGGQGAPLVPVADQLLFEGAGRACWLVNIGGIANITLVHPDATKQFGCDVGPGNCLLDRWIELCTANIEFCDMDSKYSSQGKVNSKVLSELEDACQPLLGSSLAREAFSADFLKQHMPPALSISDGAATLVALTARLIVNALQHSQHVSPDVRTLLVAGGGAQSSSMMSALKALLPDWSVDTTDAIGMPPQAREAACFAALGWLYLRGEPGNSPAVTGATHALRLGSLALY